MTTKEILNKAIKKLNKKNIKNPYLDAEILLSSILKKEREFLLTHPEKKLTKLQLEKLNKLLSRRIKGEPVAYLLGYKYFYGNKFIVNKDVLVPRPETEMMIKEVTELIFKKNLIAKEAKLPTGSLASVIDVGTGSGNIIISLVKVFKESSSGYPELDSCEFIGTDISKKALSVAKKNAKLSGVDDKIKFLQGDLLEPILKNKKLNIKNKNVIITANLPYGWKEWKNNCSMDNVGLKFEPKIALFTEEDGLKLYRLLFEQIKKVKLLCASCYVLCEIDPRQISKMKKLIKKELPKAKFEIKKDLARLDRLVVIKLG